MNAAVIEQCSTGSYIYLNKFDSNKMHCLDKTWRHVFMTLEYSCTNNLLKRTWKITTNVNQGSHWPQEIFILTDRDSKQFYPSSNEQILTIEEFSSTFNLSNNQLISYMWTALPYGPQCRIKYPITKDICTTMKGQELGARFIDFICYYGKEKFNFIVATQRETFNKLVDNSIKGVSNTVQTNPSANNNINNSPMNPNLLALNAGKSAFWKKNKSYIFMASGIGVIIILLTTILIIIRRRQSANNDLETRMSADSNIE